MLAISVMVCSYLLARDAAQVGIKKDFIFDLMFWAVVAGIAGARLFYIILNLPFFIENPLEVIMIQHGGLAWQGGFLLGSIVGIFFIKKNKFSPTQIVDLVAPYIALGQAIGRIGCFLNGCCYGRPIVHPLFPGITVHPTQLYLFAGLMIIFFILKKYQKVSKIPGEVFVLFLILEPVLRFFVEFLRADHNVTYGGLSIYQIVCLILITIAIYVHTRLKSLVRK